MDRIWFLTFHTYGTWLPGDAKGFVGPASDETGRRVWRNAPGTPPHAGKPRLEAYARSVMRGDPIFLDLEQAAALLEQFQETARHRGWTLLAVAILTTHVHLIVAVAGDPDPTTLTRDFKAYGSRRLNATWPRPKSDTWWVESGSERILTTPLSTEAAIVYVLEEQEHPLLTFANESVIGSCLQTFERNHGERPA